MKRKCYLQKLATAVKILRKMKTSIIWLGMLKVLTYTIIIVESRVAIPREYNQILLPSGIIDGYDQTGENYHKFERRLIIGHYYPYDRYSHTKLFWPEERSPCINKDRITFYKCINRTPSTASASMHAIDDGIGVPDLVVAVMYRPVEFILINRLVTTCDAYTEESDVITNKETVMCNPNDISETSTQTVPTFQTTDKSPTASTSGTMYFKETTSSINMKPTIQVTIRSERNSQETSTESGNTVTYETKIDSTNQETTNPENSNKQSSNIGTMTTTSYSKVTSEKTGKTTSQIELTTFKSDREISSVQGMAQKTTKKTLYTNRPSSTISSEDLESKKVDKISLSLGETSLGIEKTTSKTTSPRIVRPALQESVTRPMIDKTTSRVKNEDSGETNKIGLLMTEIPKNERLTTIGSREDETSLSTKKITLKVTSPKTVEPTSQKITTSLKTEEVPTSMEVQSSKTEKAVAMPFEEISLVANKTSGKDSQDERDKNSITRKNITNLKGFRTYKLVLKIVPVGRKKKIGLAKISY